MKMWRFLIAASLIAATSLIAPSQAQAAVIYSTHWGSSGGFGLNSTYWAAHKFTAASNASITSIDMYVGSGSVTRLVLRANTSNAPGSALATMSTSTTSSTTQTFTGTFSITTGTTYWLSAEVVSGSGSIGVKSTLQDTSSYGWSSGSSILSSLDYGATWGSTYVGGAISFIFQMNGTSAQALPTPNTPVLSASSGTSISVSETSTTANASSYIISLFQSNGTSLIESKTAISITSPITFTGLSAAVNYKISVTAVGDGVTYANSAASPQLSVTTPGTTSVSVTGLSNITYRRSVSLTATVVGGNGRVTFYINGKKIPRCIKVSTTSLSATCSFSPSTRGIAKISVLFTPTSSSLETSSNSYSISIGNRSGNR